ncbi:hypothetical protein [Gemmatimonas sp.]|uniref:hypothetical protein n=1 Tax=Gemmatimonas sp. TaxID=1962908 RepID=UPI00286E819C|nr:hypothetical protein [Gemmatimonas sp.]
MTQNQPTAVNVQPLGDRLLITMPSSDGTRRSIEVSADGKALLSVDGMTTTAIQPPPARAQRSLPNGVVDIVQAMGAMIMMVVVFGPLARAVARRIEKRAMITPAALSPEVAQRLAAIERAVDSVAVEVERISEGQRFTTKLLSDRTKLEAERVL